MLSRALFWVEIGVAFLFIACWIVQTIELEARAMTANHDQARSGQVAAGKPRLIGEICSI